MTLLGRALTAFALNFSDHGAAFAIELLPSGALFARERSRVPSRTTARLRNGIGKAHAHHLPRNQSAGLVCEAARR